MFFFEGTEDEVREKRLGKGGEERRVEGWRGKLKRKDRREGNGRRVDIH